MVSLVDIYKIKESHFEKIHELKSSRDPARGNKGQNREKDFYFIDEPADLASLPPFPGINSTL